MTKSPTLVQALAAALSEAAKVNGSEQVRSQPSYSLSQESCIH